MVLTLLNLYIIGDNENIIQHTPLKTLKESDLVLNSHSGKWTVTPDDTNIRQEVESNKYISFPDTNLNARSSAVKRKLVFKENTAENAGIYVVYFSMDI